MTDTMFMKKDDRPNTERLEYLLVQSNYLGIGSDERRRKILFDYHKALHTEAVSLVNTHEQSFLLQKIRYYIASEWEGKDTFRTFKDGEAYFKKNLGMKFPGEPKYKNAVNKAADELIPQNNDSSAATVDDGQFSVQPQDAVSQTAN